MPGDFEKDGRYYEIWKRAHQFHKKYAGATTREDWVLMISSLGLFTDTVEIDLVVAIVAETERQYLAARQNKDGG